ncbi:MAG: hypothetical protein C0626_00715 [Arcobacter sp.]|uniref:hypothetical protein n=1 Tax=uncultured Arcobacter sp. TaxID=165434 RepID=UPI000CB79F3A|nr:hypothetical protein [uncultured Arcobacter sp.]PLY11124.1 MAG: hypothetical protein C0626_00715 [Arcobacter sp.]
MIRYIILLILLNIYSYANGCADYFNPSKFYNSPTYLQDLIQNNLKELELFSDDKKKIQELGFEKIGDLYLNEYIKNKEQIYPKKTGLFSYKLKNNKIDELSIAFVNLYKYDYINIAEEINNDFEGFWNDWIEDGYEMKLIPEQTLFKYKKKYFSFSVFIYGVKSDATQLDGTIIKYWLKDYTKQVNKFIECSK